MELKNIISNALKKKSPDELIAVSKKSELKKTLNVFDLIILGIGAVVGTGIFTIIGTAIQGGPESAGAGPAIVISMVLAAVACVFSAFRLSNTPLNVFVLISSIFNSSTTMNLFS